MKSKYKIKRQGPGRSVSIATKGWLDLIDKGQQARLNAHQMPKEWSSFIATDGRRQVGVIQYCPHDWAMEKTVRVGVCYVLPKYRAAGVFSDLWLAFERHVKQAGYRFIDIDTHVTNHAMNSIIERSLAGRREHICYKIAV